MFESLLSVHVNVSACESRWISDSDSELFVQLGFQRMRRSSGHLREQAQVVSQAVGTANQIMQTSR